MTSDSKTHDVIIVGAGPSGLAAAMYTARDRFDTIILEKLNAGGQILLTDAVENYPGFADPVGGFEIMDAFQKQAERFGAKIELAEVTGIEAEGDELHVVTTSDRYRARAVIVATGARHRKLGIPGEDRLASKGVSYCGTCDGPFFRNKHVVAVGGGNAALDEALYLAKFCSKVTLVHRRDELRGDRILQERIFAAENVEVRWDSVVTEIKGENKVSSVTLKNVKTQAEEDYPVEGAFIFVGYAPNTEAFQGCLELDAAAYIKVDPQLRTSMRGVFAAGDVHDARYRQMATAAGYGVAAALEVKRFLNGQD